MDLMNIGLLVQEFYAIEALAAMISGRQYSGFEFMRHSHNRWYDDFHDFRDEYTTKLAAAIFDYTVMAVASELRHCRKNALQYIDGYYTSEMNRDDVFKKCTVYKANDILEAGVRMFDSRRVKWESSYGGDKWKQIAKAGLLKGKIPDCVFVDHCVDLSHNGGFYFDKHAGIFHLQPGCAYRAFLDLKRICDPRTLLMEKQGGRFNRLFWRANNLNIIGIQAVDTGFSQSQDESLLLGYQPTRWGSARLDFSERNIVYKRDFCSGLRRYRDDEEYARCA